MTGYADTSFLVSLYTPDVNSPRAAELMSGKPALLLTPFGELELLNAFEMRGFRKDLTRREIKRAHNAFESDRGSGIFSLQPLPTLVYEIAARISRRHTFQLGVRTLDILHVASALVLKAEALYTFDERQRGLANAEGLRTEGPKS
ncbi:MAG: type II toxin-antitoxin system VapC family toxin [Terriglobia bacterium]